jgi:hypothetical protein
MAVRKPFLLYLRSRLNVTVAVASLAVLAAGLAFFAVTRKVLSCRVVRVKYLFFFGLRRYIPWACPAFGAGDARVDGGSRASLQVLAADYRH